MLRSDCPYFSIGGGGGGGGGGGRGDEDYQLYVHTVNIMMLGGFMGYSVGSKMRPWYRPPSKSDPSGARIVKCHSKRLSSSGWA